MNDKLKAKVGANIQARRKQLGMNQRELAQAVGVTPAAMCRVERGQSLPTRMGDRLAKVLGITLGELFSEILGN